MQEKQFRRRVIMLLAQAKEHPVPVENAARPGTPDVNYSGGWIELKRLLGWPKKNTTPVRIASYTPQQRIWMRTRWAAGGRVHGLLLVGKEWLLYEGHVAADIWGISTQNVMRKSALGSWPGAPSAKQLVFSLYSRGD